MSWRPWKWFNWKFNQKTNERRRCNDKLGNANDDVINDEMSDICEDYENECYLFDKLFSMLNSKRETFTKEELDQYIECMQILLDK